MNITQEIISSIASIFIVISTKSYFEALLLQKLKKKTVFRIWIGIYIINGLLVEYLPIPAQLNTLVMYIFIITILYGGKWRKKILSITLLYAVGGVAEVFAYYILRVDIHPELYLQAGILAKIVYIIFIILVVSVTKRINKDTNLFPADWVRLVTLPICSIGVGWYIMLSKGIDEVPKVVLCILLLLVNVNVFFDFAGMIKSKEEQERTNKELEKKEKALQAWKAKNLPDLLVFTSKEGEKIIDKKEIMCVFAKKNEVTIIRKDSRDTYNDTIYHVYEELNRQQERFILLNRNVILNFDYITNKTVKKFNIGDIEFDIHRKNKDQVLEQYERIKKEKW